jgi:hypothetical protein
MKLPGFSADHSLQPSRGSYRSSHTPAVGGGIVAAAPDRAEQQAPGGPWKGPWKGPWGPMLAVAVGTCNRPIHFSCLNGCSGGFCCLDDPYGPNSCMHKCDLNYWPNC